MLKFPTKALKIVFHWLYDAAVVHKIGCDRLRLVWKSLKKRKKKNLKKKPKKKEGFSFLTEEKGKALHFNADSHGSLKAMDRTRTLLLAQMRRQLKGQSAEAVFISRH